MANLITLLVAVLGFVAIAGLGLALAGPGGNTRATKRAQAVVGARDSRDAARRKPAANAQDQRRKQILKTLRDEDKKQRKATLTIGAKLQQAGLGDSQRMFWIISGVLGLTVVVACLVLGQNLLIGLALGAGAGLGLPRWVVGFLANGRMKKFTSQFPDALDVITRGIKSGLPVHDCLKMIARESAEPLASEFQRLVEGLGMGVGMDQALEKMFERMPTSEVRFFAIVVAIQSKTGGNLAEALGNLSSVIRARKLMREKIKALSGEAVASAFIIGSLPPGVGLLINFLSPTYMAVMFTDTRGHIMLGAGAVMMALGVLVMRKMINFKF